mgnify:CR=1 FL=1
MTEIIKKPILSFDMDGTLMKPGFGDKVWLEGLPKIYAHVHNLPVGKAKEILIAAYDKIGSSNREWYDLSYWIHKLNLNITPQQLLDAFSQFIQPYPEVPSIIKRLAEDHTLIVSSAAMKPFITIEMKTAQLDYYFSYYFSATTDTNTVKKDPYFYEMISEKLHCKPSEIIHVGDHQEYDYISAKQAGLFAFYLDREGIDKGPNVVMSLNDFERRIQQYPFE